MKKGFFKRLAASFMASVMMLTSSVTDIITYSDPPAAEIGIFNHVFTADEEADVTYKLTFYNINLIQEVDPETEQPVIVGREKVPMTGSFNYGDLCLNADGTITIPKNERVNFLENSDFCTFLEENGVMFISIDVDEAGNKESANLPDGTPVERDKYRTS